MLNVLITGATGFVGTELVKQLEKNFNIFRVIRNKEDLINDNDYIVPSIDENTDWSKYLSNIDVIVHLAAKVHDMKFKEDNSLNNDFYRVNYHGTKKLLNDAKKHNVKKIIFLSTIKVNGEGEDNCIYSEKDLPNPIGSYAKSKYEAEKLLVQNCDDIKYIIIRPTLIFGNNVKGNVLLLMNLIYRGIPFPYFKHENQRSVIGLKNLCNLINFCIDTNKCDNQTLLVSEKKPISTKYLVRTISKYLNDKYIMIKLPNLFLSIIRILPFFNKYYKRLYSNLSVSNNKLFNDIGWEPKYNVEEQIAEMVNIYKTKKEKK